MKTAWHHFFTPPMPFRSGDLINGIFGKTAITPSLFKLKSKLKLFWMSYQLSPILKSGRFCAENGKQVFKYCYNGYKNTDLLSDGARKA